jgi:hypothetical protein
MRPSPRVGVIVLAISVAVAVTVFASPPESAPEPDAPDEAYAAQIDAVGGRIAIKHDLVVDLAYGRRTLKDVVSRFAELDRGNPDVVFAAEHVPGATAGERYCRLVINHAEATVLDDHVRAAVRARLESELAEILASGISAGYPN